MSVWSAAVEAIEERWGGAEGRSQLDQGYLLRSVYTSGVVAFLLLLVGVPLVLYVWASFWTDLPIINGGQLTFEGYDRLFSEGVYETIGNTLIVAVGGTTTALLIAIVMMFAAMKVEMRGRVIISLVLIAQYLLPGYVLALAWDFYAGPNGFVNTVLMEAGVIDAALFNIRSAWGIAFITGTNYAGLVYLLTAGSIMAVTKSLEEAALLSGASTKTTYQRVTLKLALPALAISGVLVFTRLLQSFSIPLILGLPNRVFVVATHMYVSLRSYPPDFNFAAALGMVILLTAMLGLFLQYRLTGPREQYETIGEEGAGVLQFDLRFKRGFMAVVFSFLLLVYVMPLLILFMTSFQGGFIFDIFNFDFTLDNYRAIFVGSVSDEFFTSLKNTILLSGGGALFGMTVSMLSSYIIVKMEGTTSRFVDYLTLAPSAIPGIIIGTIFLWVLLATGLLSRYNALWFIMVAVSAKFIVYGTRATNGGFRSVGTELEEAAQLSGANLYTIFRRVYLPLIKPGFLSGYVLLFIAYMKILTIPLLLVSSSDELLLQVFLWRQIGYGATGIVSALAVVIMVLVGSIYVVTIVFTDIDVTNL